MVISRLAIAYIIAVALSACHSPETRQKIEKMEVKGTDAREAPRAQPAPSHSQAFSRVEKTPLLDFTYEWPLEAAAIPALANRFTKDMETAHKDALETAEEDQSARKGMNFDFHEHQFSRQWVTAGQTASLLSLVSTTSAYTGGAHPNHGSGALLWDRKADREIKLADLFTVPMGTLFTDPWCKGIDKARLDRRQGERMDGPFDTCPPLSDLAIVPADTDQDGKFDRLRFLADPYVAGPYAEGDYEVTFAIQPSWLAAIRPEWRSSFETT
jgi:hypothetical protein